MSGKSYTFFVASTPGKMRKLIVPAYVLHGLAALAIIGMISVTAAVGSYSRMLWKVGNYNALRHDQETLKKQYRQLQSNVQDTNQRLDSLTIRSFRAKCVAAGEIDQPRALCQEWRNEGIRLHAYGKIKVGFGCQLLWHVNSEPLAIPGH